MKIGKKEAVPILLSAIMLLNFGNIGIQNALADDQNNSSSVMNLATVDKDDVNLYDSNGNKINQDLAPETNLTANNEVTKDDNTYYQVGNNSWIKGCDVYKYNTEENFVSTSAGTTYKNIVENQTKNSNRELSEDSDWYSDRTTKLNGTKYYRISTDKWVKATDAISYHPSFNLVTAVKKTLVYDGQGQVVRTIKKKQLLKSDRIAEINGIAMYRIATDEWLIV